LFFDILFSGVIFFNLEAVSLLLSLDVS
jgi:hypothetical protein